MNLNISAAMAYTARIRWRGPKPNLEIETRHPGFPTPEAAALYACGVLPQVPERLDVAGSTIALYSVEGTPLPSTTNDVTVTIRQLAPDEGQHQYMPADRCLATLDAAQGAWEPSECAVLGDNGSAIEVEIKLDERSRVHVTVYDVDPNEEAPETI